MRLKIFERLRLRTGVEKENTEVLHRIVRRTIFASSDRFVVQSNSDGSWADVVHFSGEGGTLESYSTEASAKKRMDELLSRREWHRRSKAFESKETVVCVARPLLNEAAGE